MKTFTKTLQISSPILRSLITHKPYSTTSCTFLSPTDPLICHNFIPNDQPSNDILNHQKPISINYKDPNFLSQTNVIKTLLKLKHKPFSALASFQWDSKLPGLIGNIDSFCVLFYMFIGCKNRKRLVNDLVLSLSHVDATILTRSLIQSSKKLGYKLNVDDFHCLLNAFIGCHRIDDALACFDVIIGETSIDLGVSFGNALLKELVNENRIDKAEEVCAVKMARRGITWDTATIFTMMQGCWKQNRFKDGCELFNQAKDRGFELSKDTYTLAVGVFCKVDNADGAFELLKEMKGKGWVPSTRTLMKLFKVCVQQGNMTQALEVKDELITSGKLKKAKGLLRVMF